MLARLSSSDYPALAGLRTRDDSDFSIALLDASAVVLDVLTFYQERLANESYLRTATQTWSLTQLSQLIGYQPSPGVSASTYLAFTLTAAPGLPPNPTTSAITIPAGTTVQSVAAQGQTPQTFQTAAAILGKPDWNALPVQTGNPWAPGDSPTSVYLAGTATQLQTGDTFLIAGDTDAADPTTEPWYAGFVNTVQTDTINQRTLVTWTGPAGSSGTLSGTLPTFYALRQRAALFGYNAVNPQMLTHAVRSELGGLLSGSPPEWTFGTQSRPSLNLAANFLVDLDATYSKVVAKSWLALVSQATGSATANPYAAEAYPIQSAVTLARSDYGVSGKITRVALMQPSNSSDAADLASTLSSYYGNTRTTAVLAQSEALSAAEQPLDHPLYGSVIDLEGVREDLDGITAIAVSGKSQNVLLKPGVTLTFEPYDNQGTVTLNPGDQLTFLQPPVALKKDGSAPNWHGSTKVVPLVVTDATGRPGEVKAALDDFTLTPAASNSPVVQEIALVASVSLVEATATRPARTRIVLSGTLLNCYDRSVTTVNANVGVATAGSAVTELLGNGSAATPNQSFKLKQTPLTYTQAPTPSGAQSSLGITANGASWTQVATLYDQSPGAQVYQVLNLPGGGALAQFGDGVEGATLPTGQNNLIANYRVGIGMAGNVGPGTITTLVDRPLGVKGVNNPMAATGGQDAQSLSDIRTNAPQSVLTLGRAVSITDYQNLAATFAGIAKAYAIWIPNGANRGVFLTVAAAGGAALPADSLTLANLVKALGSYGNPNIRVQAQSYYETLFGLDADIAYNPAYDVSSVNTAVMTLLTSTYGFTSRTFGQGVSGDEIATLIQGVPGVLGVNVKKVTLGPTSNAGDLGSVGFSTATWQTWIAGKVTLKRLRSHSPTRICAYVPIASIGALPAPADILVLNPDPSAVSLGVMG